MSWISVLNGAAVSIFGCLLSAYFCGAMESKKSRRVFWIGMVAILLLQAVIYNLWDEKFLRYIYPLIIHLPLVILLGTITKKPLWSLIAVLTSYLCCQLRRWLGLFAVAVFSGGPVLQDIAELILTLPLLFVLIRFVAPAVRPLSQHSPGMQLRFGIIPGLYYIFDYAAVVYTDMLISNTPVVVEFMPFVCCVAYLVFLLHHFYEEQKQNQLRQAQENLDIQLRQSVREIEALRESQSLARQYRHDLRHHLQYVSACIENGQSDKAQEYISDIFREIQAQKVQRYCENETVNLILSAFDARAKKDGVTLKVSGALPAFINISVRDICVLLSNGLENALNACVDPEVPLKERIIDMQFYMREEKFFLQITNPCPREVIFEKDLPVSNRPDHGIGVRSICAIVHRYRVIYSFLKKDEQFILRLSI